MMIIWLMSEPGGVFVNHLVRSSLIKGAVKPEHFVDESYDGDLDNTKLWIST